MTVNAIRTSILPSLLNTYIPKLCIQKLPLRHVHTTKLLYKKESSELIVRPAVFSVDGDKTKETFLEAIKMYTTRTGPKRGHVEFIYSALKYMEEFGVHRDLEAYKKILDTLPKGQYIATTMWQVEFQHYPKQQVITNLLFKIINFSSFNITFNKIIITLQNCIVDLLEQMEENGKFSTRFGFNQLYIYLIIILLLFVFNIGVIPDAETELMILNIFGRHAIPMKKLMRMSYWMPKFKNLSPWALPDKIPNAPLEVAKLAVQRMCSVDQASEIDILETKELADALDDTWIVSGQSPTQRQLLSKLKEKQTVYVEGAFTIWLRRTSINYFILRVDPVLPTEEEKKRREEFDYDGNSVALLKR